MTTFSCLSGSKAGRGQGAGAFDGLPPETVALQPGSDKIII